MVDGVDWGMMQRDYDNGLKSQTKIHNKAMNYARMSCHFS